MVHACGREVMRRWWTDMRGNMLPEDRESQASTPTSPQGAPPCPSGRPIELAAFKTFNFPNLFASRREEPFPAV